MNSFLVHLYDYISEHTPSLHHNPEYRRAMQTYMELEEKVQKKTGEELLYQYQCAEADVAHQQNIAIFSQTLRLGFSFVLKLLRR